MEDENEYFTNWKWFQLFSGCGFLLCRLETRNLQFNRISTKNYLFMVFNLIVVQRYWSKRLSLIVSSAGFQVLKAPNYENTRIIENSQNPSRSVPLFKCVLVERLLSANRCVVQIIPTHLVPRTGLSRVIVVLRPARAGTLLLNTPAPPDFTPLPCYKVVKNVWTKTGKRERREKRHTWTWNKKVYRTEQNTSLSSWQFHF